MKKKVGLISLGCPKNLVDSEIMLGLLQKASYVLTNNKDEADIIIVNTCGFIESAKKEAIDTILEMAECKKDKCELLIVTGCLTERYREEIMKSIPEVDAIAGIASYDEIVRIIEKAYAGNKLMSFRSSDDISYLNNRRLLSSDKGYAYLKIAEGCDNRCTYCVIPSIRGRYRSRLLGDIIKEAKNLAAAGKKEIILVSQDTTRYGIDLYGEKSLVKLIRKISLIKGIKWIRLLYCYPEEIDEDLIDELAGNDKLCKYMDIPIQHVSDKILRSMGRRGTGGEIKDIIRRLRERVPGVVIRTSLIAGFPGETEKDFNELRDFVKGTEFDRLGVFAYSREEGTKAAEMKNQVPRRLREERCKNIMKLQNSINKRKNTARLGKTSEVIVDGETRDKEGLILYYGRTYAEAPDIDWIVFFKSNKRLKTGDIVSAELLLIK